MAVKVFLSTDVGAPVLTGQLGSFINLLDKCLVDGYDVKPSLGWSKPFSGSNVAVYRQLAGGQRYLKVDNSSGYLNTTYNARVRGYEAMSGINTGDGPFPTDTQSNGGLLWRLSITQDSTARPWILVGDEKLFYLMIEHGWSTGFREFVFFGDFVSYKGDDLYNQIIGGTNANSNSQHPLHTGVDSPGSIDGVTAGCYVARQYTQLGGSWVANLPFDGYQFTRTYSGQNPGGSWPQFINPATGDLFFGKFYVCDKTSLRGEMPGMWAALFKGDGNFAHGDVISGTGNLTGKTLKLGQCYTNYSSPWVAVETSNTWYS